MSKLIAFLSLALAFALPAPALEKVRITGTKKTIDKRESSSQRLPHGQTQLSEKQVVYAFSLQRMTPDTSEQATASWILMRESMDGRLSEAARGDSVVSLPLGRAVALESAPVTLTEREWSRHGGSGTVGSSLAGYGLRILDDKGQIIAERYDPASIEKEIDWEKPKVKPPVNDKVAQLQQQIRDEKLRQQREKIDQKAERRR